MRTLGDRLHMVRAKYGSPVVTWEVWAVNKKITGPVFSSERPSLVEVIVRGPLLKKAYTVAVCLHCTTYIQQNLVA